VVDGYACFLTGVELPRANGLSSGGKQAPCHRGLVPPNKRHQRLSRILVRRWALTVVGHVKIDQRGRNGDSELQHEVGWLDVI
jgi:hypothetical protein